MAARARSPGSTRFSIKVTNLPRHGVFSWVGLLVVATIVILAAINLWAELQYSLRGAPATGKIIAFHNAQSRSRSVQAEVEVALSGAAPFHWTVDDTFGTQNWQVGGPVPLLCTHIHVDHVSCVVDSWLDRFLFPLFVLTAAAGLLVWRLRRRRSTEALPAH